MGEQRPGNDRLTFTIKKSYLFVAVALLIGLGGGIGIGSAFLGSSSDQAAVQGTNESSAFPTEAPPPSPVEVSIKGRPYLGPEDAAVTVVEFTDYECPFCSRHFRQTLPDLLREYEGRVRYVVRNYPIDILHPFAQKAAEAAECAYDQGKFWEYHDLVLENQDSLDSVSLKKYASDLALDTGEFELCLDSEAKGEVVLQDRLDGREYGVTGTPTFFINGVIMVGAQPLSRFRTLIDAALASAGG